MEDNESIAIRNFLNLVLNSPGNASAIALDDAGWADVDDLIHQGKTAGLDIDFLSLVNFVENEFMHFFEFNNDLSKIRVKREA